MDALAAVVSQWSNNQGFINAMTVQLYEKGDRDTFNNYLKSLTPVQYRQALSHFNTVKQLKINTKAWRLYCEKETEKMAELRATLTDKQSEAVRRYIVERNKAIAIKTKKGRA